MKFLSIVILAITLAACGNASSLTGNYRSNDGKSFLVFSSDGKVKTKLLKGNEVETTYTIADNTVSFQFPNGLLMSYTINRDGSLNAPWSSGYKKS